METPGLDPQWRTVKKVPSLMRGYPKGSQIQFRPYTFGEVKAVSDPFATTERVEELISSGIRLISSDGTVLPSDELSFFDLKFVALTRLMDTIGGQKWTVSRMCDSCQKSFDYNFNHMDLDFNELKAPALPLKVELQGKSVFFNILRCGRVKQFRECGEKHEDWNAEILVIASLMEGMSVEEAYQFLYTMPWTDQLEQMDDLLDHGLKPIRRVCPHCKDANVISLQMRLSRFRPFRVTDGSVGDSDDNDAGSPSAS